MLGWALNLGFAGTGDSGGGTPATVTPTGASLLIGTGCWLAPLFVALIAWGTR